MVTREKRTQSGPLLEIDIYPVWDDGRRVPSREPKSKATTEAKQKYNDEQAVKRIVRLVNANFDKTDYWMHPTYFPDAAPQDEREARRDLVNYIRRVRDRRKKELADAKEQLKAARVALDLVRLNAERSRRKSAQQAKAHLEEKVSELKKRIKKLNRPLKYVYVIERQVYKTGKREGLANWHFHLFISGGLDDKTMEALWKQGVRVNCDNYQPDRFGPEAAARYMGKDPQGRRWSCSRNLTKPAERTRDGKYTRRQVEKIATQRVDEAAWWERQYPGYRFLRCLSRWNEYNANWYVTAVMYKTDLPAPAWLDQWSVSEEGDCGDG